MGAKVHTFYKTVKNLLLKFSIATIFFIVRTVESTDSNYRNNPSIILPHATKNLYLCAVKTNNSKQISL